MVAPFRGVYPEAPRERSAGAILSYFPELVPLATIEAMPAHSDDPVKETCRLIRLARSKWDAHDNMGCRTERDRALALYETLSREQRDEIPQVLRVWLRYRSEKYFGPGRTPPRRRA